MEAAAADLGYVANDVARALRTRSTLVIGAVVPDVTNPFFSELMRAIEASCRDRGLAVLFGNSDGDSRREREYVAQFSQRQVDGLLLVGVGESGAIDRLLPESFPIVGLDRIPDGWTRDRVAVDSDTGAELAVEHLVGLGHRRIAFVGGDEKLDTARTRRAGFSAAIGALGVSASTISEGEFTLDSGLEQGARIFNGIEPPPTAIVAANDLLAMGVLAAARLHGVDVPGDLSVVGFDDSALATLTEPRLTTIRQPVEELAQTAVAAALERMADPGRPRVEKLLSPELMVRDTSVRAG